MNNGNLEFCGESARAGYKKEDLDNKKEVGGV